ncbi:MAG: HAMP domain-containing sensor histidine kinase [Armatimonadota bacterium]|nr:HAMP domain-containing protein [bacterium]
MRFVPKTSVRTRLMLSILLVIVLSWILSSGTAYYLVYRDVHQLRQQMLSRPDIYPVPIPEPAFNFVDFLFGPRQVFREMPPQPSTASPDMKRPPQMDNRAAPEHDGPPEPQQDNPPPGEPQNDVPSWILIYSRVATALILALVAGTWLGRTFTRPLSALAAGAKAFHSGNLGHRIEVEGDDEFTQVASAMNEMASRVSNQISRLERDAERRRQLLADVAHELRSPVTTMQTMSGALADGVADDPQRRERAVTSLVNVSDRLANLVSDLLELAKLDLQELPLHPKRIDLREVASKCVQACMQRAGDTGIILMPVPSGSPVMINADPDRIAQVLDNLLDNAISYAGQDAQVNVDLIDSDPVKIMVSDNGHGISEEHISHIFDAFYRADAARTPGDSHSGLGLRIARGLIEAHGGKLTLTSKECKGTRVEITLPALKAE